MLCKLEDKYNIYNLDIDDFILNTFVDYIEMIQHEYYIVLKDGLCNICNIYEEYLFNWIDTIRETISNLIKYNFTVNGTFEESY